MSGSSSNLKCLFSGMASWHMGNTARGFYHRDSLSGIWVGNANRFGIPQELYRRIWPHHLAMKPFYHLVPGRQIEEAMRWHVLPLYDLWLKFQSLPAEANVVQAPMGSCEGIFALAKKSGRRILKVFDAPNTHPVTQLRIWQDEADQFCPGYKVPVPQWVWERQVRELAQADVVLCPSLFVRETMIAYGVPEAKCMINRFGVDVSIFKKRNEVPKTARFVTVGSVCVRKGHQYLFRAFAQVKKRLPDAELVVVGGVRPDFALEWPQWKNSITHHEHLSHPQIAELFQQCSAFVLPSLEEGFARVFSEAMAAGLPIVATHESGATTVVENGNQGLIVPAKSIGELAEAMILVATDAGLNAKMSLASWESGGVANTWQDYSDRLMAEYKKRISLSGN